MYVHELPKNAVGKLPRRELRERAKKELQQMSEIMIEVSRLLHRTRHYSQYGNDRSPARISPRPSRCISSQIYNKESHLVMSLFIIYS